MGDATRDYGFTDVVAGSVHHSGFQTRIFWIAALTPDVFHQQDP